MIWPFGTMICLLSPVFRIVVNICTCNTTPAMPAASTKSPTRYGRNITIRTPDAKFASEPCKARPTARPAAPMTAISEVVCTPIWLIAAMMTKIINAQYARLHTNVSRILSTSWVCITLCNPFVMRRAIMRPTKNMTNAINAFMPNSRPVVCTVPHMPAQSIPARSGNCVSSIFYSFFIFVSASQFPAQINAMPATARVDH